MDLNDLLELKEKELASRKPTCIRCCMAAGCISSHSQAVKESLEKAVKDAGLSETVEVRGVGCMRLCCQGPLVQVDPSGVLYERVTANDAPSLVGTLNGGQTSVSRGDANHPFFTKQMSVVLANSGSVDPERIESYIAADGYQALHDALHEMTPKDVVDAMVEAVWAGAAARAIRLIEWPPSQRLKPEEIVICNADEGDLAPSGPQRSESDPHSVLEGMAIAAYASADQGSFMCGRDPLAISRLQTAIKQAVAWLLGSGILNRPSASTSISASAPGDSFAAKRRRSWRRSKAGGPTASATAVPSRERFVGASHADQQRRAFANVPAIACKGADWFAGIGTEKAKARKSRPRGKIVNTGLIEVPMGTPLRQIVEEMEGRRMKVKAVQTGGPRVAASRRST